MSALPPKADHRLAPPSCPLCAIIGHRGGHGATRVDIRRRELLRLTTASVFAAGWVQRSSAQDPDGRSAFDVRSFGATADGKTLDTPAVNRAIAAAAAIGGGTVRFPAGVYACHSIRLKSFVTLYLERGAAIVAAPAGGYDPAESNAPFESYQDFGHNHWHNSLIWGEGIHDVAILGLGLICGRAIRDALRTCGMLDRKKAVADMNRRF
jgi:polygalacturonase